MALLKLLNINKYYEINSGFLSAKPRLLRAVEDVSLTLNEGRTFGLVGESGCGKSTLARIILKLIRPSSGEIFFKGNDITGLAEKKFRLLRREIQIVFQDPYGSLSPRLKIKDIIAEPLEAFKESKQSIKARVEKLIFQVGLNENYLDRLPNQLSGGERQRVGIARALANFPKLLVLDEAVSSLDLSTQAQILNLLVSLQKSYSLSYLFIAHNLSVVKYISDEVAVMCQGVIVEKGDTHSVYNNPRHPYTRLLLKSMPSLDKHLPLKKNNEVLSWENIERAGSSDKGCIFCHKCSKAQPRCHKEKPVLIELEKGHWVNCLS